MKDRVDFSITNNGISVGANVTRDYFEERVLPLISSLLVDMSPTQKRRTSSRYAAKPEQPNANRVGAPTIKAVRNLPAVTTAPDPTRAAAISSYSHKPPRKTSRTHLLA